MSHKKAIILTCGIALLWSLAGWNIKMITWSPYAIAAGRSIISVVLLLPMVVKGKSLHISRNMIGGAVCYTIFNYCFIISTKLATSAIAIMMQYTAPVYVAVLAWIFLKERITKADLISIVFIFGGMFLFFTDEAGGGSTAGKIIAVFNGISFARISIFLRLEKDGDPKLCMFFGNLLSGIVGIPFIATAGPLDTSGFFFLLLAGILCALTYTLYAAASTGLSALETVLLPIIDPVMNPVWVFLFLGEAPGSKSIMGAAVVLIAVTARVVYGIQADAGKARMA